MINYINEIAKVNKLDRYNAIIKILKENNIKYDIQSLPYNNSLGNIIVTFNPENNTKFVISAHYDNAYGTPGANDNAAACSILLNLILNFRDTKQHLEFVFFDLEEKMFLGSRYYLENNKDYIWYAINLDMCGIGENILFMSNINDFKYDEFEGIIDNYKAIRVSLLPPGDAYSFIYNNRTTFYIINSTDNDIKWYKEYTNKSIPKFKADFLETMHKPNDTIDNINYDQVDKIFLFVSEILKVMCDELSKIVFV